MSNIGKRWAKPSVWEKPFFTALNIEQRLFWLYLNNRCDPAGVYQLHFPVDSAYLGITIDEAFIQDFLTVINSNSKRIELITDKRLWLVGFVHYQQIGKGKPCLSKNAPPHINIVNKLKEHGIFDKAVKKDPVLYREYTGEVVEKGSSTSNDSLAYDKPNDSHNNKPKDSLVLAKSKGYSNSSSNSSSNGDDNNSNNSKSPNSDKTINPKSSLYYNKIVKQLKQIIPEECINCSDQELEADVETYIGLIESAGIEEPRAYLIAKAKHRADWESYTWDEFDEILNNALAEVPF